MYAIIENGGKQYRVEEGSKVRLEEMPLPEGDQFVTDQVLLLQLGENCLIGKPLVSGAQVVGRVVQHGKEDKVLIFKKKRRKQYRRTRGHRQLFLEVEIEKIQAPQGVEA